MKKTSLLIVVLMLYAAMADAQNLYTRTFGQKKNPAVIYLHGGPGYNCVNFEVTTAQKLAEQGFYVVVYDRRGEGRSEDKKAQFTFAETFADLNQLYKNEGIKKATLIGHSFGGVVATRYASAFPEQVRSIVLVGAPVSLQETFKTIHRSCKTIYEAKQDTVNLKYLTLLQNMDSSALLYSSYSFMHAMQNGFYTPKNKTAEAKAIYALFKTDTALQKHGAKMSFEGPKGFWEQEHYTTIDLTDDIKKLAGTHMKIYGLYGREDGLYSPEQVDALGAIIGYDNLEYYEDCSHNVFIDQQKAFLSALKKWGK